MSDESSHLITQFEKNSKEEVRVSIDSFRGKKLINIRVFFRDTDRTWKPGKQGLALSVEQYRHLADAVLQTGEYLEQQKLLS